MTHMEVCVPLLPLLMLLVAAGEALHPVHALQALPQRLQVLQGTGRSVGVDGRAGASRSLLLEHAVRSLAGQEESSSRTAHGLPGRDESSSITVPLPAGDPWSAEAQDTSRRRGWWRALLHQRGRRVHGGRANSDTHNTESFSRRLREGDSGWLPWWQSWLPDWPAWTKDEEEKGCHPGCPQHGNCNTEDLRCECRFGYGGPDCATPLAPACTVVQPGEVLDITGPAPRSCECLIQLAPLFLVIVDGQTLSTISHTFSPGAVHPCFNRTRLSPSRQNSTFPQPQEPVTWHRLYFNRFMQPFINPLSPGEGLQYQDMWGNEWQTIPPAKTIVQGDKAHKHCAQRPIGKRKTFDCKCTRGYTGDNCDQIVGDNCPNNCSGHGQCRDVFCHCHPGFFGFDCSRQRGYLEGGRAANVSASQFKIYMYELPANIAYDDQAHDPNYIAYIFFRDMLARDWSVRTENPWEASLFFIPDASYWAGGNVLEHWPQQHRVFQYLNATYPFWQRNDGRDHFHFVTRDRGSCDQRLPRDRHIMQPMKLVHFGYHEHVDNSSMAFIQAHGEACIRPMRDLVVPGFVSTVDLWVDAWQRLPANWTRDVLLFFRGGIRPEDPEYSGGVRQRLAELLANNSDPDVWYNHPNHARVEYGHAHRRSVFCLAPWGHGWGIRLQLAMASGCIPVIIQDHVLQPFEYLLPYHEFSIRLSNKDVDRLIPILRSVSQAEVRRLQEGVRRHYRPFMWQGNGTAYETTIAALKQHWTLVKAGLDRRRTTRRL